MTDIFKQEGLPGGPITLAPIVVSADSGGQRPNTADTTADTTVDIFAAEKLAPPNWNPSVAERAAEHLRVGFEHTPAGAVVARVASGAVVADQAQWIREAQKIARALGLEHAPAPADVIRYDNARRGETERLPDQNRLMQLSRFAGMPLAQLNALGDKYASAASEQKAGYLAGERAEDRRYAAMMPVGAEEGFFNTLASGAAAVGGELGGQLASPENWIPGVRAASLGKKIVSAVATNAAIGAAADPVVQAQQIATGEREAYDFGQTVMQGLLSGAAGGVLVGGGSVGAKLVREFRDWFARAADVAPQDVERSLSEMDPAEAKAYAEAFVRERTGGPADEPLSATIDAATGADRAPATGDALKQRRKELGQTFEAADKQAREKPLRAPVTRRADVSPGGEVAPDAQPAIDRTGTVLPTDQLAGYREIANASQRHGLGLSDAEIRTAADALARARAAGENPDALAVARAFSQAGRRSAFDIAEARRQRRESRLAGEQPGGNVPGGDYQAGGREYAPEPREAFIFLDPVIRDGQMVSGARIEPTNQWRRVEGPKGEPVAEQLVRLVDVEGQPAVWVTPERLHTLRRPANVRQAQDTAARSTTRPAGVGLSDPGPRTATDRISSKSATFDPARPVDGELLPERPVYRERLTDTGQPPGLRQARGRGAQRVDKTAGAREDQEMASQTRGDRSQITPQPQERQNAARPERTDGSKSPSVLRSGEENRMGSDARASQGAPRDNVGRPAGMREKPEDSYAGKNLERASADADQELPEIDTNSDEFQEWFEYSEVAENGRPTVVYHATDAEFDAFDWSRLGEVTHRNAVNEWAVESAKIGPWFAERDIAQDMASDRTKRSYLAIENPKEYVSLGALLQDLEDAGNAGELRDTLARQGYDGIKLQDDEFRTVSWAPFSNDQIRRAQPDMIHHPRLQTESFNSPPSGQAEGGGSGGTLYSGIPIPEIVKVAKTGLSKAYGGTPQDRAEYAESLGETASDLRESLGRGRAKNRDTKRSILADGARDLFIDTDANLRILIKRFDSDTLRQIPDLFHALSGRGDGVGETFHEAVIGRTARRTKEIDDIMNTIRRGGLDQKQIVRMVQHPEIARSGKAGRVAAQIQRFFAEEFAYLDNAGVEMGQVARGYFPRIFDQGKVANRRGRFVERATQAYRADGDGADAAAARAEALWESVVYGDIRPPGVGDSGGASKPSFLKSRQFSDKAAAYLEDFRATELDHVMSNYVTRSTRRAELAKLSVTTADGETIAFGDNFTNWKKIEKAIGREDDSAKAALHHVRDLVSISSGTYQPNVGAGIAAAASWLRTWTTLSLLEKAAFSSMGELVLAPLRASTGNVLRDTATTIDNLGRVTYDTLRTVSRMGRSERLEYGFELSEDMGIIAGNGHQHIMAARFAGGDPTGRFQSKAISKYFRWTMLDQLTNYTRVNTMLHGQVFIRRLAHDLNKTGGKRRRALHLLREMGVARGGEDEFATYVRGLSDLPALSEIMRDGQTGKTYRTALRRFTDQTVQHPTTSTRPRYAAHPLGAVLYQLQSFNYTFQKNVLLRHVRMAKQSGDLTGLDKALMASALVTNIPLLMATQYAVYEAKDYLYKTENDRPLTDEAKLERAWSAAGLNGILDPYIQMFSGVRYRRSPAESLLGPALGSVSTALADTIGVFVSNSENTNTAERNLYKGLYEFLVTPAAQLALTFAPQFGLAQPVGTYITVVGLPKGADPIATLIGGPPSDTARNDKPIPGLLQTLTGYDATAGPKIVAPSRSGGRSGSRSNSRGGSRAGAR